MAADDSGFIDLRPDNPGVDDPQARRLAVGRLSRLERMGLATAARPGQWMISPEAEPVLRDLGVRGDIIKTMHRALTGRGQDRGIADYVVDADTASSPIIGRLVATGLHDELTGQAYAVIDGVDGRAHHVRFPGSMPLPTRRPRAASSRCGGSAGPMIAGRPLFSPTGRILDRQVTAPGATWLDHRLVEHERMPLAMSGVGQEVRNAMQARAEHLAVDGLAHRQGPGIVPQRDLLATLRRRELDATGARLSFQSCSRPA